MNKEAIQKGIDALRGVIAWDIMRNHLVPYRVRDPIHEAIEALAALAEQPAPAQQEPVAGLLVGQDSDGRYVSIAAKAHADTLPLGEYKLYTSPQPARRTWVEVEQVKWEGERLIAKLKENT